MDTITHDGFTLVTEEGGISQFRMDSNGLDVLLVPMDLAPVTAFMITYRVGSRNESTGETGATHFLEHLMFKGTERFSKESGRTIFNTLQRVGARVNATTWLDRTNYYELLPEDKLSLAIEIEADRMRGALLSVSDVDSERTVILNELDRGENEPLRKLYQSVWSTAFCAHPYRHPTIGWRSDVENLSADQLRSFYDTYYWPNNATVSVIGSFEIGQTLKSLATHFGEIPSSRSSFPSVYTREPDQQGSRKTTVRMAGGPGALMVAFKSPPATDKQTAALQVLSVVLGSGKSCRLYRALVDTGLAIGTSASSSLLRDPGLFYAYAMLSPGVSHEDVEKAILGVTKQLIADPISSDELTLAKAVIRSETAYDRDGAFSMASGLNEAIAAGDWRLYLSVPEQIAGITANDVLEAAGRILLEDQMTVGYFVPRDPE